ncbi:unnamed protein product [Rotaria sp. Silwood1]|nr:unnamed protein product [Rotaria sp. Silwood1]
MHCTMTSNKNIEFIDLTKDEQIQEEPIMNNQCQYTFRILIENEISSTANIPKPTHSSINYQQTLKSSIHNDQTKKLKSYINKYMIIDCLKGLQMLPNNSVQCIVTSPPYNKLDLREGHRRYCKRDYPPENFILQCNLKLYQTIIWDRVSTVNQNFDYFRSNLENNFLNVLKVQYGE